MMFELFFYMESVTSGDMGGSACGRSFDLVVDEFINAVVDFMGIPAKQPVDLKKREETWEAEDVRRHWQLRSHCEYLLFPQHYPSLQLVTSLGSYLWHQHCRGVQFPEYYKHLARCVSSGLTELAFNKPKVDQIIYCDHMLNYRRLDLFSRQHNIDNILRFFGCQEGLLMVSLENMEVDRREGTYLLLALGMNSGHCIRRLYLWNLFDKTQHPNVRDRTDKKYKGSPAFWGRLTSIRLFRESLSYFSTLTVLAINYCYLADATSKALLSIGAIRTGVLKFLQLLCEYNDVPDLHVSWDRLGAFKIAGTVWTEATRLCPNLQVHLIVMCLPCFDIVKLFLSPCMPLTYFYLSSGMDLRFQQPWLVDCTLRVLKFRFAQQLLGLSIQLWRNRDHLDSQLLSSVDDFPCLKSLEFTGIIRKPKIIRELCSKITSGYYELEKLVLNIQPITCEKTGRLRKKLKAINRNYKKKFQALNICFKLKLYLV